MPITQKIAAALLLVFLALLAGAAIILDRAVRPGFERLEDDAHVRNLARVVAAVETLRDDVRSRTIDYTTWDDTYYYVGGESPEYTDYFSDEWLEDYGVDLIAFISDRGELMWQRRRLASGESVDDPALAMRLARLAPPATAQEPAVAVTYVENDGALIVAAAPARLGDGSRPERGLVIMGRRLSGANLGQQAQLDARVLAPAAVTGEAAEQLAAIEGEAPQSWSTDTDLYGLFALRDFTGAAAAVILTEQPREITAQGARAMGITLALFAAMCAIVTAALWFLLRAGVIRRIIRLEQHFNAQSAVPEKLHVEDEASDEIARLTGSYNALVARLRDTMAREQAAQLQSEAEAAANRMKSDFLANVSHELRTPLNAVIGYAELIKEELNDEGFTHTDADLERIVKAARRLLGLVNEILDLSKIEVGRLEMKLESFRVEEMMERALDAVRPLASSLDVELGLHIEGDLGIAYSDEFRLRQCLINVLASACKFAPGESVSLHAVRGPAPSGEMLRFEIRDTGPGLSEDQLAYAFEPFQRAGAFVSATVGGASLGLAMTRKLITLLGGRIEAASTPGQGSTFVLEAPVVAEDEPAQECPRAA